MTRLTARLHVVVAVRRLTHAVTSLLRRHFRGVRNNRFDRPYRCLPHRGPGLRSWGRVAGLVLKDLFQLCHHAR